MASRSPSPFPSYSLPSAFPLIWCSTQWPPPRQEHTWVRVRSTGELALEYGFGYPRGTLGFKSLLGHEAEPNP